jgi:hypothetical protein
MAVDSGLNKFAEDFHQEVISRAEAEDNEQLRGDQFTDLMFEYLAEAGEIEDGTVCYHRAHGMQVNGYSVTQEDTCLDLFISICSLELPLPVIPKSQIETSFKRLTSFFQKALNNYHLDLEEASPVFDLALRVHELKDSLRQVRLFLLTDGLSNVNTLSDANIGDLPVSYHIWDIRRLFRLWSSGNKREAIEVDFDSEFGGAIPCLVMPRNNPEYNVYLAIIPGKTLVELYGQYGPRLLERNVRSFLQVRGKVNKGIRDTIFNEPHMFLAYNNGISATAESIKLAKSPNGGTGIRWARDLQIVNGGQTTASIYQSVKKDSRDISDVFVQVKLTVLKDHERINEVVPRISRYANSQNKVSDADFSANDPFHIQIENLSRTVWAPAAQGMQRQTRWYYERARGQYLDDKGRERTPAKKSAFATTHPQSQKFTKTDLAKFENTWNQLPHVVSRGAEKNFLDFTVRLKERGQFEIDQKYFEHLVAKAILFRQAEKIVHAQKYGGYRANIVTYTLAWLSHFTAQRIDLDQIWREQSLSQPLKEAIELVSKHVHGHIINPPGGRNVTEWCKKEECWKQLSEISINLPGTITKELQSRDRTRRNHTNRGASSPDSRELKLIAEIMQVPDATWFRIAAWAKETDNLLPWQRGLSFSLGRLAKGGKEPTVKQATQGLKILKEAERLGFRAEAE